MVTTLERQQTGSTIDYQIGYPETECPSDEIPEHGTPDYVRCVRKLLDIRSPVELTPDDHLTMARFVEWYLQQDPDLRPPLIELREGVFAILENFLDFDGTLSEEIRPPGCPLSYDRFVFSDEAMAGGRAFAEYVQSYEIAGGHIGMNLMTGRSTGEAKYILKQLGVNPDTVTIFSCDGGELRLSRQIKELMTKDVREAIEAMGYRFSTLQDGTEVISLGEVDQGYIAHVLSEFEQARQILIDDNESAYMTNSGIACTQENIKALRAQGVELEVDQQGRVIARHRSTDEISQLATQIGVEMVDPIQSTLEQSNTTLVEQLYQQIGHPDIEITQASIDRSTSAYIVMTEADSSAFARFVQERGYRLRVVESPHVTPTGTAPGVVEIHGLGTSKASAIDDYYRIMAAFGIPSVLSFFGNGTNDAKAVIRARMAHPEASAGLMPKDNHRTPFPSDDLVCDALEHGVLIGDEPAGYGLLRMVPSVITQTCSRYYPNMEYAHALAHIYRDYMIMNQRYHTQSVAVMPDQLVTY